MARAPCAGRNRYEAQAVARVVYSPNAVANLERARAITTAVDILEHHPFVGRIVRGELRELVISFGRTGYVALYRFLPGSDEVRILALRHQRELDYPDD